MSKTVALTSKELKLLDLYLDENPCRNGCVYEDMKKKNIECSNCKFTIETKKLKEKLYGKEC